jgi:ribosomal protein S8
MPRKTGGKITSHLLSAHGGEIFIHSLNTSRSVLEDSPSISEGVGGKVVNYR